MTLKIDEQLSFSARVGGTEEGGLDFEAQEFIDRVGTGFSKHGVRKNYAEDGELRSVDVVFEAMEAGPPERRNGVRITEGFLREVAGKDYSHEPPHLVDHRKSHSFSNIGTVKNVWFSEAAKKLAVMVNVPNTGSATHDEAIARYSFDPPAIRDGSVGFGTNYTAERNDAGEAELVDATLQEFSAVNFPGGYDDGGVAAAFAAALDAIEVDDPEESGENSAAADSGFAATTETITFNDTDT